MKPIVLLSGPVAAGKTTVGKLLVSALDGPVAYLEGDVFWSFLPKLSRPTPRTFKMVMASMTAAAVPYAVADFHVIVDFSIPPWFLETAKALAAMRNIPLDYVVIKPSEDVCVARAAARPTGRIADYTPYRDLYADFATAGRHILTDDTGNAATVAARIRAGLETGLFRVS